MKKLLRNISIVLLSLIVVACTYEPETFTLKNPVAPELKNHATILVTNTTMNEDVIFAWNAARTPEKAEISYSLFGKYKEDGVLTNFGTTTSLSLKMSKKEFNEKIIAAGFPETAKDEMIFILKAYFNEDVLESKEIKVTIVSQGELIAPKIVLSSNEIVLDAKTWDSEVVLSWNQARLENEAEINYKLFATLGEASTEDTQTKADENPNTILLGETTEAQVIFTQEAFNEILVNAGIKEKETAQISLYVVAYSNEYPDGIQSNAAPLTVTTYEANYPPFFYVPGSHQGWSPATAPLIKMTDQKGIYESFIDLTSKGEETEFKFSPNPEWKDDFGGEVTVNTEKKSITASGTIGTGSNIKVPSGIYRVVLNYKTKTIEMVKVETLGLIGNATANSWDAQTNLTYNSKENIWETVTTFTAGEYKFRLNDDWDWAIGSNGIFGASEPNFKFEKEPGEYKVIVNTSVAPYKITILSTTFPEKLYTPGSHQGWDPASSQTLNNNGEGIYEGFINLVDKDGKENCEFKFSPKPAWGEDFGGSIEFDATKTENSGTLGGSANIIVPNGYYKLVVNMPDQTFTLTTVTSVAFIGTFNKWEDDDPFTFNAEKNVWEKDGFAITTTTQFKIRLNKGWDMNFGGTGEVEPQIVSPSTFEVAHNGKNLSPKSDGTYKFTLDLKTTPYTLTME
jgi:hypothetical protein